MIFLFNQKQMLLKIVFCVLFILLLSFAMINFFINRISPHIEFKGGEIKIGNMMLNKTNYTDFQCSIINWLEAYNYFCVYDFDKVKVNTNNGLLELECNNNIKSQYIKNGEVRLKKFLNNTPDDILDKIINYELIYRIKSGQENYEIDSIEKLTSVMYDLQKDTILYNYGIPTKHRFIDYFEMIYVYYTALCGYKHSQHIDINKFKISLNNNYHELTFESKNEKIKMEVEDNLRMKNSTINGFQKSDDIELYDIPKISPFGCQCIHPNND